MHARIASLHFYPIKSCGGIETDVLSVGPRGPAYDREWMLIHADTGEFLTQRELAPMTRVRTTIKETQLRIAIPQTSGSEETVSLPLQAEARPELTVSVWGDSCAAYEVDRSVSQALGNYLQTPVRLVRLSADFERRINEKYGHPSAHTSFSDSMPFLLVSLGSLADLNAKLESQVPIDRFRANLVIEGASAFAEDGWKSMRIGQVQLDVVKPCARCIIINTDQTTGERFKEPLKTLSGYRRLIGNKVLFGQYLVHKNFGEIRKGDQVILEA